MAASVAAAQHAVPGGPTAAVVMAICPECQGNHVWKACPQYLTRRRSCTKGVYFAEHLAIPDAAGYAAAGVLPWTNSGNLLFALQERHGETRLSLLGGKREYTDLDARHTARREFLQETGTDEGHSGLHISLLERLSEAMSGSMLWFGDGKYVVYHLSLHEHELLPMTSSRSSSQPSWSSRKGWLNEEVIRLQWVHADDIVAMMEAQTLYMHFHGFTADILRVLFD